MEGCGLTRETEVWMVGPAAPGGQELTLPRHHAQCPHQGKKEERRLTGNKPLKGLYFVSGQVAPALSNTKPLLS